MHICYLGVGSNLGNRKKNLELSFKEISRLKDTSIIKISEFIETLPMNCPQRQKKFLNAALKVKTKIPPFMLLNKLKSIERRLGRPFKYVRNSPRLIDIDILFYDDRKIISKQLTVPHPKAFRRDFVMRPLLEIL